MGALAFSDAAVIEARVGGVEVAASLIGPQLDALPLVEISPKSGVYDYAARYTAGATEYHAPARIGDAVTAETVALARSSSDALGLRDLTRVDVMIGADGLPTVLEVNVSPGMTETSLLPMAARAAGVELGDVCDSIIRAALDRTRP
jgi:D-alanine-D-alanine ligase